MGSIQDMAMDDAGYIYALVYNRILKYAPRHLITTPYNFNLNVIQPDNGQVSATNLLCGDTCITSYPANTSVTLTAQPAYGYSVATWSGCDSVSADKLNCQVTLNTDKTVRIAFTATPTACDPVYNNAAVSYYVSLPLQDPLDGRLTGESKIFYATFTETLPQRFRTTAITVADPLPSTECTAQIATATVTPGYFAVHLPRIIVPEVISVLGQDIPLNLAVYQLTLTWDIAANNFRIETFERLE